MNLFKYVTNLTYIAKKYSKILFPSEELNVKTFNLLKKNIPNVQVEKTFFSDTIQNHSMF